MHGPTIYRCFFQLARFKWAVMWVPSGQSKKEGKDQESIQSSITPDAHMG